MIPKLRFIHTVKSKQIQENEGAKAELMEYVFMVLSGQEDIVFIM